VHYRLLHYLIIRLFPPVSRKVSQQAGSWAEVLSEDELVSLIVLDKNFVQPVSQVDCTGNKTFNLIYFLDLKLSKNMYTWYSIHQNSKYISCVISRTRKYFWEIDGIYNEFDNTSLISFNCPTQHVNDQEELLLRYTFQINTFIAIGIFPFHAHHKY
jgi:hypothetical protein